MKKKVLPVLIAVILIIIIGGIAVVGMLFEKYSYSKEEADLNEYFHVTSEERSAIILQDAMIEEQAVVRDGVYYFDLATVHKYFNEIFYADEAENILLYTTPTEVLRAELGGTVMNSEAGSEDLGYVLCYAENGTVYVAADYVKKFTNYTYEAFERHMQVYTEWGNRQEAEVKKNTAVRLKGGVKSPVLKAVAKGEKVEILEAMENWSKVKTTDSYIGYIENKMLVNETEVAETPETGYEEPEYTSLPMDGKVSLGWHSIGGAGGNVTLDDMVSGTKGMNVIAPTWFSMNDEEGGIRSFGTGEYVQKAHDMGLQVWGVVDDFNYNLETGAGIDAYNVLSVTTKRQRLVQNIIDETLALGLDGVNVDFEKVTADSGSHYVQFLRELSVQCRKNGLVLSVDNYVPFHFNDYYRLDIQGQIADYVIIMGYDEHWAGCSEPGSVASIDYVANGLDRTLEEVPAEKVVNALPFYTRLWKIIGAEVSDVTIAMNNKDVKLGAEPVWDEATCQNYAEWTEGNSTYQIWLEDAQSIGAKLNVMNSRNIGGVAVWRLGYGTGEVWEMLSAYVNS